MAHKSTALQNREETPPFWSIWRTFFESGGPSVLSPVKDLADGNRELLPDRLFLLNIRLMFTIRPVRIGERLRLRLRELRLRLLGVTIITRPDRVFTIFGCS